MISSNYPKPESLVRVRVDGATGTIVLNRPARRNALSRAMISALKTALDDLNQQGSVRAVVLTGAGSSFCSGTDLAEIHETNQDRDAHQQWFEDVKSICGLYDMMLRLPKPVVVCVNGPALAAGLGLVTAADTVLASNEAKFGFPECKRGLCAGVVTPLIAFRVGAGPAANMLLRGHEIPCAEAHRIGLVHEIVAHDLLWARACEIAAEIACSAPESILMTKRVLNENVGEQLSTLMSAGAAATASVRTTENAAEGVAAFLAKRDPQWHK